MAIFVPDLGPSPGSFKLTEPVGEEVVPLEKIDVLPRSGKKPEGCVLQMWVSVAGLPRPISTVCDGGAEVAMISQRVFQQLDPQPELRLTTEKVKGLYGPDHTPLGESTLQVQIPELSVAAAYDFIVDDIEEDLLVDASLLHYTEVQLTYDRQELVGKGKVVKAVARLRARAFKARRVILKKDWVVQPRSRQLVPGRVAD